MAVAILLAAGKGERLGCDGAKAFVTLAGKPMLQWSLDALGAVDAVQRIVIAVPSGRLIPLPVAGPKLTTVVGGASRSASMRAALAATSEGDPVLVHDAARPLASAGLFERALDALRVEGCDAAIAATPVTDTVKRADEDGTVLETLDRSHLWAIQTPQAFRRAALERALEVDEGTLAAATDDAWLVERAGGTVRVVAGEPENLKVTTPLDLRVAEQMLSRRT